MASSLPRGSLVGSQPRRLCHPGLGVGLETGSDSASCVPVEVGRRELCFLRVWEMDFLVPKGPVPGAGRPRLPPCGVSPRAPCGRALRGAITRLFPSCVEFTNPTLSLSSLESLWLPIALRKEFECSHQGPCFCGCGMRPGDGCAAWPPLPTPRPHPSYLSEVPKEGAAASPTWVSAGCTWGRPNSRADDPRLQGAGVHGGAQEDEAGSGP